jgi:hypothetical protein
VAVDGLGEVFPPLVDAEEELGLGGVGDEELGEGGDPVMVVVVLGGEDVGEVPPDGDPFQDLPQPRADDVVAQPDPPLPLAAHEGVHPLEPALHAGEVLDVLPELAELLAADVDVLLVGLFQEEAHVGEHRLLAELPALPFHLGPEFAGGGADLRQHRVLLHRLGGEGAVEVIDEGDGVLFEGEASGGHGGSCRRVTCAACPEFRLRITLS